MTRPCSLCICIVALVSSATLTRATVTPISYTRYVSTFAFLDYAFGQEPLRSDETIQFEQGGSFDEHAVCHVEHGSSYVTALANQSSSIDAAGIQAAISASAEGAVNLPERGTLGLCSTAVTYEFSVDTPTPCHLSAQIIASGGGTIDIDLGPIGGGWLVNRQFFETDESYDQQLLLPPGSYQVVAGGGGDGATGPNGLGASSIELGFSLTFPTAAVAVGDAPSLLVAPNPTHGPVRVSLEGHLPTSASIQVIDARGRLVRTLEPTEGRAAPWDLRSNDGERVAPGVYFVRAGRGTGSRFVVLP